MKDNVALFPGDVSPEAMLEKAKSWGLKSVVVAGRTEDGVISWGSSSTDPAEVVFVAYRVFTDAIKHG